MKNIWIIAKREFQTFLDSLVAYILLIVFLGLSGFFTWLFGSDVFFIKQATMEPFFQIAYWTLFFFIPALTMRMIAEEKKTGTLEVLLTRAVSDWQIVFGKFLACLDFDWHCPVLYPTLLFYDCLVGTHRSWGGLVWLFRCDFVEFGAYIGIGIFASSITNNQIVAFLLALVIGIFFHWIFDLVGSVMSGGMANLFHFLSTSTHYSSISRGVIDSRDVIYFISIALLGLILAEAQLARRNVVD